MYVALPQLSLGMNRADGVMDSSGYCTVVPLKGVIRYLRPRAAESPCICYRRKTKVAYMNGAVMKYHP